MSPLSVGYYLLNFETVIAEVRSRYRDLLHEEEHALLDAFLALPLDARRIYVRMLIRRGPWFREDALDYREIAHPRKALETLVREGFCDDNASLQELIPLLNKEDLISWLKIFEISSRKHLLRENLVERLLEADELKLTQALRSNLHPVMPLHQEFWSLIFFLFFGNGEQDLSSFVLADTGRVAYETYAIDAENRLFRSRMDVDFLFFLRDLRTTFDAVTVEENRESMTIITDQILAMEPHPGVRQQRRYHRLLNDVGRAWERRGEMDQALACYTRSRLPPARERIARITKNPSEACRQAIAIAASPLDLREERFAQIFLRRHAKRISDASHWLADHPLPDPVPGIHLTVPRHPSGSVELAALDAARAHGWDGFFTENVLWNALFGLVFWEEIFAPVPGAFQHRFQSAPLDIGSVDFYSQRTNLLEARLQEILDQGTLIHRVLDTAKRKWSIANAFISWRHLTQEMLIEATERIPSLVMVDVLHTMVQNPRAFTSGFPDLFLFKPGEPTWTLWEVKGPGDVLRPEQERWLHQFRRMGCDARVAWVKYEG